VTALDLPPEASPVVVRDLFPAEVQVGGSVYRTAFAVITRERLYVWQAEGRDRILRFVMEYDPGRSTVPPYHAPPRQEARLYAAGPRDDLAGAVVVRRQRGCGCSSSLRGWRPWRPYRIA
jgi:hypothetical protein